MIIITNYVIIGVDCTGKTTLIEELSKRTGLKVIKGSSFQMTEGKSNEELFEAFMELSNVENVIFDRFSYCNYVYANNFEDYSSLTIEQIREIELSMKDTKLIYLTASNSDIIERFNTRGEEYVTPDKIQDLKNSYHKVLQNTNLNLNVFDTSYMTTEYIVNYLLERGN